MKFTILFLTLIVGVASEAKTSNIQCHTTYGYQLQASASNEVLNFIFLSYGEKTLLIKQAAIAAEQSTVSRNDLLWNIDVPSKNSVVNLVLPKEIVTYSAFKGTLIIKALGGPSAEFPLLCESH